MVIFKPASRRPGILRKAKTWYIKDTVQANLSQLLEEGEFGEW